MDWSDFIPLVSIIYLFLKGAGVGGVSFVRPLPLISCHRSCAHSRGKSPIWKGLICFNPSGKNYLPPGRRSGCMWSVPYRVSFVRLNHLFSNFRRHCCAHSCWASPLGKVCVGCNPSGHYHTSPGGRSGCGLICLSTTFSSFLS